VVARRHGASLTGLEGWRKRAAVHPESTRSRYNTGKAEHPAARHPTGSVSMWHLIEDFFEQSLVMKGFIGLGWLSIMIMVTSIIYTLV
jgi:hypothetical protein